MKRVTDEELALRETVREELQALSKIKPGEYDVNPGWFKRIFTNVRGGWLVVERKYDCTSIHWTSHRTTHHPNSGPSMCISFTVEGTLEFYMESAITMWVKWHVTRGTIEDLRMAVAFVRWVHWKLVTENAQPS